MKKIYEAGAFGLAVAIGFAVGLKLQQIRIDKLNKKLNMTISTMEVTKGYSESMKDFFTVGKDFASGDSKVYAEAAEETLDIIVKDTGDCLSYLKNGEET